MTVPRRRQSLRTRRTAMRRLARTWYWARRRVGITGAPVVTQAKDQWPADWKPMTIAEMFDQ